MCNKVDDLLVRVVKESARVTNHDKLLDKLEDAIEELQSAVNMLESRINGQNTRLSALEDTGIVPKKEIKIDPQPKEVWFTDTNDAVLILKVKKNVPLPFRVVKLNGYTDFLDRSELVIKGSHITVDKFLETLSKTDL